MDFFFPIVFGSFVLEDVALASGIALALSGRMEPWLAATACFVGIGVGDLGVYALGFAVAVFGEKPIRRIFPKFRASYFRNYDDAVLSFSIVVSRAIPGTRLPTYFTAGLVRYSFWRFLVLTVFSVAGWVALTFYAGKSAGLISRGNFWGTLALAFTLLWCAKFAAKLIADPWRRKALPHAWRKWMHFEFWPAWFFYLPIVPFYAYLALRARSLLPPFFANPRILNGGLIGESKYDFLKDLSPAQPSTLKSLLVHGIPPGGEFEFPFILKPDVGQRGYGVRIVHAQEEVEAYFALSGESPVVAQTLSRYPRECGILYFRRPGESGGEIFSITDKDFPELTGDGVHALGDLILRDPRARIIAPVYFARHRSRLGQIFASGEKIQLSACGNHCQGAIFKNGKDLISPALTREIDMIAKSLPDFHFGRFDIRYQDAESLRAGENFEIVEVNGAGSEATHIWDPKTTLREAYAVLFAQWKILFQIGTAVRASGDRGHFRPFYFLWECARVIRRNDGLSVSS